MAYICLCEDAERHPRTFPEASNNTEADQEREDESVLDVDPTKPGNRRRRTSRSR